MNWARLHPGYRREYRKALARSTPLIDGQQTRWMARVMRYDAQLLKRVAKEKPVAFEPRATYSDRLTDWVRESAKATGGQ